MHPCFALCQVRLNMANVLRIVADSMPPGALNKFVLRKQFLLFMDSTVATLKKFPPDTLYGIQLCYCLCSIVASTAPELIEGPGDVLAPEMRKTLFYLFSQWCAPGSPPGMYCCNLYYILSIPFAWVLYYRSFSNMSTLARMRCEEAILRMQMLLRCVRHRISTLDGYEVRRVVSSNILCEGCSVSLIFTQQCHHNTNHMRDSIPF